MTVRGRCRVAGPFRVPCQAAAGSRRRRYSPVSEPGASSSSLPLMGSSQKWRVRRLSPDPRKRRTTGMKEGNEGVLHRRSSESRWPRPCVGDPRGRSEALDRGARRPAIEPRNAFGRGADAIVDDGRQHRWRRFRESSADPAGSENPLHACDLFMLRTGRSRDHPPVVVVGRVVRGRPRP